MTLSEISPEPAIPILDPSLQLIEQLNSLTPPIASPSSDPRDDFWIRIDKEIEFITVDFPDPLQGQILETICRTLDTRSGAFRIPSSPQYNIHLLETYNTGLDEGD